MVDMKARKQAESILIIKGPPYWRYGTFPLNYAKLKFVNFKKYYKTHFCGRYIEGSGKMNLKKYIDTLHDPQIS